MSDSTPSTPPGRGGSIIPDSQATPRVKRSQDSGRRTDDPVDSSRFHPYGPTTRVSRAPSPSSGRVARSTANSPTPSRTNSRARRHSISLTGPGVPGDPITAFPSRANSPNETVESGDDSDMDEDLERVTGTINPHGIGQSIKNVPNVTPEQAETVLALGEHTADLLDATTKGATTIRGDPKFAQHIGQIIDGTNERGLFPGNTVMTNASKGKGNAKDLPDPAPTPTPIPTPPRPTDGQNNGIDYYSWLADISNNLNQQSEMIGQLQLLCVHITSQANVMASFDASVIYSVEQRLRSIENTIKRGPAHPQTIPAPVPIPPAQVPKPTEPSSELLSTIARKVASIEQQVKTKPAPSSKPTPKANAATSPPQQAGGKGHSPAKSTNLWCEDYLTNATDEEIAIWAAIITLGKWGAPNGPNNAVEGVNYNNLSGERMKTCTFIRRAFTHHYSDGNSGLFIQPKTAPVPFAPKWVSKMRWSVVDRNNKVTKTGNSLYYAKDTGRTTTLRIILGAPKGAPEYATPPPPPQQDNPSQEAVYYEDLWDEMPEALAWNRAGKDGKTTKAAAKTFANAVASGSGTRTNANAPRKYAGVPVNKFMDAPPKQTFANGPRRWGQKYMLKFHNDEKPTKGTAMPEAAIVSEVNRVCSDKFHIRANACEWSPAMNLMIWFTGDSTPSNIDKARNTILGLLAKNCPKAIFIKSVKWSRIVIRDCPTKKWVHSADGGHLTGDALHGEFVSVTQTDLEAAIRGSHPILQDAVFTEGPNWTALNPTADPDRERANVTFTLPDPDESRFRSISRSPLFLFNIPCFVSRWTEKIHLIQCNRCWKFGDKVHPNCPIRCRQCGGPHEETEHDKECKKCKASDIDQVERENGNTVCPHDISCANCQEKHHADSPDCKMRNHAVCEARQRKKVGNGQTFISSYTRPQATRTNLPPQDGGPLSNHFRPPTEQEAREIQMATDGIPSQNPGFAGPSAMDFSS